MTTNDEAGYSTSSATLAERATKITVAVATLCYSIGFLTLNVYLGTFGVSTNTFVSTEYVLAGLTWLVLTGLAVIPTIVRRQLKRIHASGLLRLMLAVATVIPFAVQFGILFFVLDFLAGNALSLNRIEVWFSIVVLLLGPALVDAFAEPLWANENSFSLAVVGSHLFTALMTLLLVVVFVAAYAIATYPLILPAYGGGRPRVVRVVFDKGAVAAEPAAVVIDQKSGTCLLIADAGEWLILARRDATPLSAAHLRVVVCVKRDSVAAFVPLGYK